MVQITSKPGAIPVKPTRNSRRVLNLQGITLAWMCVECGVSLFSAWQANSVALLAFGSDSFLELLSAIVVLLQFTPRFRIRPRTAARIAAILLALLALMVGVLSIGALAAGLQPETTISGIAVSLAAVVVMPMLSRAKRKAARETGNLALAADAVQSATCAYLAAVTLLGLLANAAFHIRWIDPVAGLAAMPILFIEAKRAYHGDTCACC